MGFLEFCSLAPLGFFSLDCGYEIVLLPLFVCLMQLLSYMLWMEKHSMTFSLGSESCK